MSVLKKDVHIVNTKQQRRQMAAIEKANREYLQKKKKKKNLQNSNKGNAQNNAHSRSDPLY